MKKINHSFICEHCGQEVLPHATSSRNHCTSCLYSKHLDLDIPGDRASHCHGLMKPVGLDHDGKKGYVIMHKCEKCSKIIKNKVAEDDNWDTVIALSFKA